jgi:hypothetical protein
VLKKVLAGIATVTVLAVGGVAVAGAVSAPKSHAAHQRGGAGNLTALAMQTAAKTIGIDVKTLRAGVRSGHTIAEVAQQHHVAPSTVVNAIVARLNSLVDAAVKSGKLSASRATKVKQRIPALADHLVNRTTSVMRGLKRGAKQRTHNTKVLDAAAAAIGISPSALRNAMHSGESIAAIARAHGVDPAKVANAMAAVAMRNFDATAASGEKFDHHYGALIPKIMQRVVNGQSGPAAHEGVKAKAHAAAAA